MLNLKLESWNLSNVHSKRELFLETSKKIYPNKWHRLPLNWHLVNLNALETNFYKSKLAIKWHIARTFCFTANLTLTIDTPHWFEKISEEAFKAWISWKLKKYILNSFQHIVLPTQFDQTDSNNKFNLRTETLKVWKLKRHTYHKGLSYFGTPKKLAFFTALSGHLELLDEKKNQFF